MINVDQDRFAKLVSLVSKASSGKPTIPVLSNIVIDINENDLLLMATDLEIGIKSKIVISSDLKISTSVNAKSFSEFLSSLPNSTLQLEINSNQLIVQNDFTKAEFNTLNPKDFPKFPEISEMQKVLEVSSELFTEAINRTIFSTSQDNIRPILGGILFEETNSSLSLVGLDGFRMSKYDLNVDEIKSGLKVVIPSRVLSELVKIASNNSSNISLYVTYHNDSVASALFTIGDIQISTRILDGTYPDYKAILPQDFSVNFKFDRQIFLANLRVIDTIARNIIGNRIILEAIDNGKTLLMSVRDPERGLIETKCDIYEYEGDSFRTSFSSKYLSEMINSMHSNEIHLSCKSSNMPNQFVETSNHNYLHIIMPIRLD